MDWNSIFISIACGLIASFVFLFVVLLVYKPRIRISPYVCKGKFQLDEGDWYFIKIVNVSLFSAYDIKMGLYALDQYTSPPKSSLNKRYKELNLALKDISHIPPYRPKWWRQEASHAIRVRTKDNLTEILNNDHSSIVITISLKHGLTSLTRVYTQAYSDISQIEHGRFTYGTKFGILK